MTVSRIGEPKRRRGLKRPSGKVRSILPTPGDIPLDEAFERVDADWEAQIVDPNSTVKESTLRGYRQATDQLIRYAKSRKRTKLMDLDVNLVRDWISAPGPAGKEPTLNVQYWRLSAARLFLATAMLLGLINVNVAASIHLPNRRNRFANPLKDRQIRQLKNLSRTEVGNTRTPAALALAMLGAGTAEIAGCRVKDVDLENKRVWLSHNDVRYKARWVPIDEKWCLAALRDRVEAIQQTVEDPGAVADRLLIHEPVRRSKASPGPRQSLQSRAQSSVSNMLTALMQTARIHDPGKVRVESIREWAAHRYYKKTKSLPATATLLGMRSLDQLAAMLQLDWSEEFTITDLSPDEQ
jgi:site-specific recombinase XerC